MLSVCFYPECHSAMPWDHIVDGAERQRVKERRARIERNKCWHSSLACFGLSAMMQGSNLAMGGRSWYRDSGLAGLTHRAGSGTASPAVPLSDSS